MKILTVIRQYAMALVVLSAATPVLFGQTSDSQVLRATTYNSHFPEAAGGGEAFHGIGASHNGTAYYVLSSAKYNDAGQMYSFDSKTKGVTHLADLRVSVGEGRIKPV